MLKKLKNKKHFILGMLGGVLILGGLFSAITALALPSGCTGSCTFDWASFDHNLMSPRGGESGVSSTPTFTFPYPELLSSICTIIPNAPPCSSSSCAQADFMSIEVFTPPLLYTGNPGQEYRIGLADAYVAGSPLSFDRINWLPSYNSGLPNGFYLWKIRRWITSPNECSTSGYEEAWEDFWVGPQITLSVSLTANPASGNAPLTANLTADVSGTAVGTINYNFWWNCNSGSTSVAETQTACGSLPTPGAGACLENTNGYKCNAVNNDPKTISHIYSTAGSYTAKVIAERGTASPAENRTSILVATFPDLIIQTFSVVPSGPLLNDLMTFSGTVKNQGAGNAGGSSTRLRIDIYNDGTWDKTFESSTNPLIPGATEVKTWNKVWTAVAGMHKYDICADNGGAVDESDENNNCEFSFFTTAVLQPDLTVLNQPTINGALTAGQSLTFTDTVINSGSASSGAFRVRYCIDNNNCLTNSTGIVGSDINLASLNAGATSANITSAGWTATAGNHTIYFCADVSPAQVAESNKGNNCNNRTFIISPSLVSGVYWQFSTQDIEDKFTVKAQSPIYTVATNKINSTKSLITLTSQGFTGNVKLSVLPYNSCLTLKFDDEKVNINQEVFTNLWVKTTNCVAGPMTLTIRGEAESDSTNFATFDLKLGIVTPPAPKVEETTRAPFWRQIIPW